MRFEDPEILSSLYIFAKTLVQMGYENRGQSDTIMIPLLSFLMCLQQAPLYYSKQTNAFTASSGYLMFIIVST
jgi:hypothetical protein